MRIMISDLDLIVRTAHDKVLNRWPLSAMDALHVAAAHIGKVDVLFTVERRTSPLYLVSLVNVVFVEPPAD
jgi:hypothetical protein